MSIQKKYWQWYSPCAIGLPELVVSELGGVSELYLGDVKLSSFDSLNEAQDVANKICALCDEAADKRAAPEEDKVPTDILKFEPGEKETYRIDANHLWGISNSVPSAKFEVEGIGDVNGTTKGSGARYNTNKPKFDLIPVRTFIRMYEHRFDSLGKDGSNLYCALTQLAEFQEGDDAAIAVAMQFGSEWAGDAVRVLEFGAKKYAEWNWAKGMSWQTIIGCALRHAKAVLEGEQLDAESGQTHLGHFLCNLVFLDHYVRVYREGDDRPPAEFMK